jgi:DNA transformation protein and related proteins
MRELTDLKNIGKVSAKWLNEIGVYTDTDLQKLGVLQAYLRIKFREPKASLNLLYALWGALEDVNFNQIPESVRVKLKREVESLLEITD